MRIQTIISCFLFLSILVGFDVQSTYSQSPYVTDLVITSYDITMEPDFPHNAVLYDCLSVLRRSHT